MFHSISAFCTAGFSLFCNNIEGFANDTGINIMLSVLCYLGGVGFIVWMDLWRYLRGKTQYITFTSRVILLMTFWFTVIGTLLFLVIDPSVQAMEPHQKLMISLFQIMSAGTTAGFNTLPIGEISNGILMILIFLMIFGASPSGTGGGLRSTTFSALFALAKSMLKRRDSVRFFKREVPAERLRIAVASALFFQVVICIAVFLLSLLETHSFMPLLFESISALATVGLSMGITGALSPLGKLIIIALMLIGRVGVLTFGYAVAIKDETVDRTQCDNDLVV